MAALEEAALHVSEQVLFQAAGLLKAFPAVPAVVVAATLWAVVPEFVQRGWKTVPAFNAQIGGVLAFAQPVAGQQRGGSERPAALGAVVGLQPAVHPLVLQQDGVVLEALVTLGAFVRPRLLPPARGRGDLGPLRRFGKVRRGGRVSGQLFVEHDDLRNAVVDVVLVLVTGARVGRDGHFQRWRQSQRGKEKIVRLKRSCGGKREVNEQSSLLFLD